MNDIEMVLTNKLSQTIQQSLVNHSQNPYQQLNPNSAQQGEDPKIDFAQNFQPINYPIPVQQDIRSSFAADRNVPQPVRCSMHCRSLLATIFLFGGISAVICLKILKPQALQNNAQIAIPISSYVMYLLLSCICNDIYLYLTSIQHGQFYQAEYDKIRKMNGKFKFWVECYHYEGNQNDRKVVTHTATQYLIPKVTLDISGQTDRIRAQKQIVFIEFTPNYCFKTDRCRRLLDELYYSFQKKHKRDKYQRYKLQYQIGGLIEKQSFYVGQINCKYIQWYFIFGVFGFIWPFSVWVQSKVDRFNTKITKLLTL